MGIPAIGSATPYLGAVNAVSFEGTGIKKARCQEREELRAQMTMPAPVKEPMVNVPANALKALFLATVMTAAALTPQKANAQQFPPGFTPAAVVRSNEQIPEPRNYINKQVIFANDYGGSSCVKLIRPQGGSDSDIVIEYALINTDRDPAGKVFTSGIVIAYSDEYILLQEYSGGKTRVLAMTSDIKQALSYIQTAARLGLGSVPEN